MTAKVGSCASPQRERDSTCTSRLVQAPRSIVRGLTTWTSDQKSVLVLDAKPVKPKPRHFLDMTVHRSHLALVGSRSLPL